LGQQGEEKTYYSLGSIQGGELMSSGGGAGSSKLVSA